MQETETIDQVQSKDSLAEKKESSEGSGLLSSIDHNVTDAHTGYNVHREALNEAAVISGDQFHEPHALVVRGLWKKLIFEQRLLEWEAP